MKVYELFTGLGGFGLALKNTLPDHEVVLWSEIDRHAISTYESHFPEWKGRNVGDIGRTVFDIDSKGRWEANEFRVSCLPDADLIVGGSPCQDLSIAKGRRHGLIGEKSFLFYAFSEIVRIKNPKYFLLENVASMDRASRDEITNILEVEPVEICSDYFTPQKRKRLHWFNWDLKESLPDYNLAPRWPGLEAWSSSNDYHPETGVHLGRRERCTKDGRANTLTTGKGCSSRSSRNTIDGRLLTPEECEQLQALPIGWTAGVPESQRYKQVGNAVTVSVVEYILRSLRSEL